MEESRHVFIRAGLRPLLAADPTTVTVLEMGFGTGLNALLVRLLAREFPETHFHYVSYERYPISATQLAGLNYPEQLGVDRRLLEELHRPGVQNYPGENFDLDLRMEDFLMALTGGEADVIFYDAFAPNAQPELWTTEAMEHCYAALREGGWLVTYCAQGQFKRNLRAAGFRVEALPGPPGKREMTRGGR